MGTFRINVSAPNLVVLCVDSLKTGYTGRVFHRYSTQAEEFQNLMAGIDIMEQLFDRINYPQASTETRCFNGVEKPLTVRKEKAVQVMDQEQLLKQNGDLGTFVIHVQYRQNATWQGQVTWADKNETKNFRSALELLKLIDGALNTTMQ